MRVSQSKIDEIASAVDIVEIISQYTNLRKAGRSFMGRCPFHEEKTPSFSVSQEKGVYHCFGCGKSGNVFTFIMDMDNVTFSDAIKTLAEKANIPLEFYDEPEDDRNQIESLYEIHKQAARYYYDTLMSHDGIYAREYLEIRGIKPDMLPKFGLGFSLRYKDSFYQKFKDNFSVEDLNASGLVYGEDPKDKFRGRLMFPIISESGRVVAFGARKLFDDDYVQAKYVNSPETKIYNKSKTLYGLSFAKNSIKEKGYVILVEGYLDLISLVQNGILNVAASSGTSLTNLHVRILSRYTNEIVIVYDADKAGQLAARRAIELILENDMQASIIVLPSGEDPDSYIMKNTQDAFEELVDKRKSFINYIGQKYMEAGRLDTPEGKSEFMHEIISLIAKMRDPIKRDYYIKDIADKYSIYETILRPEIEKELKKNKILLQRILRPAIEQTGNVEEKVHADVSSMEINLIRLLVDSDEETQQYLMDNLDFEYITNPETAKIINYVCLNLEKPELLTAVNLFTKFNDSNVRTIISRALLDDNYVVNEGKNRNYLSDAKRIINTFKMWDLKKKREEIKKDLKAAGNDVKKYQKLLKQIGDIDAGLKALKEIK
ncbi:MAG: DNA primase [Ignavibacteriae bacterium]|nr:MAG: DNA primase [Ignavibacteriota bacterium]